MKYISMLFLIVTFNAFSQTDTPEFKNFKHRFPVQSLPFSTSALNRYRTYDSISVDKFMLKNNECLEYFFNGNKSLNSYKYESFNMETGEVTEQKEYEYSFYPAFRLESQGWLMLGFLRDDMNDYRYYVALYKAGHSKIKALVEINRVNQELLPDLFEYSLIDKNLNISVVKY
jgi:hypothetical protein